MNDRAPYVKHKMEEVLVCDANIDRLIHDLRGTILEISPQLEEQLPFIPLRYRRSMIMGEIGEMLSILGLQGERAVLLLDDVMASIADDSSCLRIR